MGEEEVRVGLRKGKKKDGPSWVMFAGGAIAVAAGAAFGRRKILEDGRKRVAAPEFGLTAQAGDENGSIQVEPLETVPSGTPRWSNLQLALPSTDSATFQFRSSKPKRPASTDPSPPVTKFIRQATPESPTVSEVIQADPMTLQSVKRSEVVSRLRQQIRSRDAVICDMQTQLADQDQIIAMHRNHCAELQDCVQEISDKLYEAKLEIQRLQRELMKHKSKPVVDLDEEFIDYAISEIRRQWVHPEDVEDILMGARKLHEEVERMRREREAKEKSARAKSRQCDLLSKRLSALTAELEEVKSTADGKQRLLDVKEQEYQRLTNVVQDLQRKLEIEARGKKSQDRSVNMISIMKRNSPLGHNVYRPTHEEVPSTFAYYSGGNARKPHGSVPVRNGSYEESASRGEPRCLFGGYTKRREAPGDQEEELENDAMTDESLIRKFGRDLDHLACALSVTSNVVLENAEQANDLEQHDLDQVAQELTRHQGKLAELKSRLAKITAQNTEDDGFIREGSSFLRDLERKLSGQEKIAKETFLVIQKLATSKHLTSPSNLPVQAWRTVHETPRRPSSYNIHQEYAVLDSSNESSRNAPHEEVSPHFWERQGLPGSALRSFSRNKNTERQTSSPLYEFQLGALESTPASSSRPWRQSPCVENQSQDPDTSTRGFTFSHYMGDRMSSPEPEPKFSSFNPSPEPCITPGLSNGVRSEFSPSPATSRYLPLAQFGSPWFRAEPSARLPRPLFTSPAPGLDFTTSKLNLHEDHTESSIGGRSYQDSGDIGVSPFAARMERLKVDKEFEERVDSLEERRLFSEDVEALCQRIADMHALEGGRSVIRESSGSSNPDEPVVMLPSVLRRSNESSNQHR